MNTYIRSAFISRPFNHVFNLLLLIVRRKSGNQSQKLTSWQQSREEAANHSRLLTSVEKVITMQEDPSRDAQTAKGEGDPATTRKAPFGTRYLTDPKNVFQHNAWDNVVWDEEQEMEARRTTQEQLEHAMSAEQQEELEREADMHWDKFYNQHQNRFFKDRHWLFIEFPELYSRCGLHKSAASATTDLTQTDTEMATSAAGSCVKNKDTALVDTEKNIPSLTRDTMSCGVETVDSQDEKEHCRASGPSSCKETHIDSETGKSTEPQGIHSVVKILKETSVTSEEDDCAKLSSTGDFPGASATFRLLEVGCGVGNTVFPVLSTNNDPGLMMYCCDFSSTAVQLVKEHPDYDPRRCHAFVWDITDETVTLPFPSESLDIIILIFVLSAVHPDKMQQAVNRLASCLKPGGQLLFRDYGRYDLAQLRFKKGRCLSENFYVRGDGTRCYFFTQEELRSMFTVAGLDEVQNLVDRRLQVNRGRQIKMYRVWVQCKYRKPPTKTETLSVEHKSS